MEWHLGKNTCLRMAQRTNPSVVLTNKSKWCVHFRRRITLYLTTISNVRELEDWPLMLFFWGQWYFFKNTQLSLTFLYLYWFLFLFSYSFLKLTQLCVYSYWKPEKHDLFFKEIRDLILIHQSCSFFILPGFFLITQIWQFIHIGLLIFLPIPLFFISPKSKYTMNYRMP